MISISILDILPQRPPFVFIDYLLYCDQTVGKTSFLIKENNLFLENNYFSEAGLIENMAQTCAAHIGYNNRHEDIKIGLIGAVKNLKIYQLPEINQSIETKIQVTNAIFNTTIVDAEIVCEEKVIAQCELKVSITEKTIASWKK